MICDHHLGPLAEPFWVSSDLVKSAQRCWDSTQLSVPCKDRREAAALKTFVIRMFGFSLDNCGPGRIGLHPAEDLNRATDTSRWRAVREPLYH